MSEPLIPKLKVAEPIPLPPIWLVVCTTCEPNIVLAFGQVRPADEDIEAVRLVHELADHERAPSVLKLVHGSIHGLPGEA